MQRVEAELLAAKEDAAKAQRQLSDAKDVRSSRIPCRVPLGDSAQLIRKQDRRLKEAAALAASVRRLFINCAIDGLTLRTDLLR